MVLLCHSNESGWLPASGIAGKLYIEQFGLALAIFEVSIPTILRHCQSMTSCTSTSALELGGRKECRAARLASLAARHLHLSGRFFSCQVQQCRWDCGFLGIDPVTSFHSFRCRAIMAPALVRNHSTGSDAQQCVASTRTHKGAQRRPKR